MEYVHLGSEGPRVSRLCLGGWQLGGRSFGHIPDDVVRDTIAAALDCGINFFDIAPCYGRGRAEELFGRFLPPRSDVVLATKVGLRWGDDQEVYKCLTPESMTWELETSLRRLRRDCIDLYLVHWPDAGTPLEETFRTLERFKASGKVRRVGICNYGAADVDEARRHCDVVLLQSRWNLLEREFAGDVEHCRANDIAFVAHSTLATGLLTGKYTKDSVFDDARNRYDMYKGEAFARTMERVEGFRREAEDRGMTLMQYALRFVLDTKGVSAAVVGARNAEQIVSTVRCLEY